MTPELIKALNANTAALNNSAQAALIGACEELTKAQAMLFLGVSDVKLWELVKSGEIAQIKCGSGIRAKSYYPKSDLTRYKKGLPAIAAKPRTRKRYGGMTI